MHEAKEDIRICAVITEETTEAARAAMSEAAGIADLAELRLDYLRDFDFRSSDGLRSLLENKPLPVIITCRAVDEGGRQHVDDTVRLRLLIEGARRLADYCDVEASHYDQAAQFLPDVSRLIVSYHNFTETPSALQDTYDRIAKLPAAVHKIVTRPKALSDSIEIFRLLNRARSNSNRLIALAMDGRGLMSRVLGPSRGSFLTYGSLGRGRESAPGQTTCEELVNLYRVRQISRDTMIFGIIGSPVAHSASPAMHNAAFAEMGLDAVYFPMEVDDVGEFFARFVNADTREIDWNLGGFSVTIPHKSAAARHVDEIDPIARAVGAVNTVVFKNRKLIGYNTDVEGALKPLEKACAIEDESFAVIGAGGAARAVVYGLLARNARVSVFARNPDKAQAFSQSFEVPVHPHEGLASSDARIVINTTPVGMLGHSEGVSPLPRAWLRNRRIAYDLVYNPTETQFLKDAGEEGCKTIGGIEMLVAQAAIQFELWTGRKAPMDVMFRAALGKLGGQD